MYVLFYFNVVHFYSRCGEAKNKEAYFRHKRKPTIGQNLVLLSENFTAMTQNLSYYLI